MWTCPSVLGRVIRKALREEKGLSKLSGQRDGRGHRVDIQRTAGDPLACRRGGDRNLQSEALGKMLLSKCP